MGVEDAKKIIKKYIMVPVFMVYMKEQMSNHNIIVAILESLTDFANYVFQILSRSNTIYS